MAIETINITDANVVEEIRSALPEATMTSKGLFGKGGFFFRCMDALAYEYNSIASSNGFKDFYTASEPRRGYGIEITFSGYDYWLKVLAYSDGDIFTMTGDTIGDSGWKKLAFVAL